jgi:hypothetical protein
MNLFRLLNDAHILSICYEEQGVSPVTTYMFCLGELAIFFCARLLFHLGNVGTYRISAGWSSDWTETRKPTEV